MIEIEKVIKVLNGNNHRGRCDWTWGNSSGQVMITNHETMPIHPRDAEIIAKYYIFKTALELIK